MPVRATPEQAVAKWLQNLGNSSDRMKSGAMSVTESPGARAARAADKWLMKVTAAKDKYIRRVGAVTTAQWQDAYINVGIPRVAQGAQAKQAKFLAFQQDFLSYLAKGLQTIDAMPSNTVEDGVNRAAAMIRYNAKYVRK